MLSWTARRIVSTAVAHLRRYPLCQDPDGLHAGAPVPANGVAYLVPLEDGGADEWRNRRSLCGSCLTRKMSNTG